LHPLTAIEGIGREVQADITKGLGTAGEAKAGFDFRFAEQERFIWAER
jgi:hypothetical protein